MKKLFLLIIIALQYSFIVTAQNFPTTQGFASKEDSIRIIERRKQAIKEWEEGKPERERLAKEYKKQKEERMRTAEFVFEGIILKNDVYAYVYPDGTKEKRFSAIIEITKVFKGNLKIGTVEIVSRGECDVITNMPTIRESRKNNTLAIFFKQKSNEFVYNKLYNIDDVDNKVILTNNNERIGYKMNMLNGLWWNGEVDAQHITKDSLYNYLRKIEGLNIPDKAEKWEPKEEKQPAVTKQVKQGKTIKEINDEILRLKKKENKVRKIQRSAEATQAVNLTYSFSNFNTTYSSTKVYLEYDVNVSATSSVYYTHGYFYVQYDNAFASNIISGGKCTVTRDAKFVNATYNNYSIQDYNSSVFTVLVGQNYDNTNNSGKVLISSTPQRMVHIKMEVNAYNSVTQLNFYTNPSITYFGFYSTNLTTSFLDCPWFDNVYLQNPSSSISLCPDPVITGISSSTGTFTAGRDQIISIKGTGFGGLRGAGGIWFISAEDGGANFIVNGIDKNIPDFQVSGTTEYWTDTEIKIKLPSKIFYKDENDELQSFIIGEGNIKVTTTTDKTSAETSYGYLPIEHCFHQFTNNDGSVKKLSYLKPVNLSFKLGATLQENIQAAALVRRALKDWSCHLNISLTENSSSANVIDYGALASGTKMSTEIGGVFATYSYPSYITIKISNTATFDYSTPGTGINGQDFYAAILHELGHTLMLEHRNNSVKYNAKLMYYFQNILENETDRITLDKNSGSVADANFIAQESKNAGLLSYKTGTDVCPTTAATPTLSATCPDNNSVQLDWDYLSDANSYSLETSYSSSTGYTVLATTPNNYTTSYTHSGLSTWSTLYYRIRAFNQYGFSGYSNEISKTVYKDTPTETVEINKADDNISIYPNPADETVFVRFNVDKATNANIAIQSFTGSTIIETGRFTMTEQAKAIDISTLQSGIYLLKVETDRQVVTRKLIVK